jgi:superfamily II DNA or RNA helicase
VFIQNKKDKGMILTEDSPRDSRFRFPNRDVSLFPHQQAMLHHCSGEIEDRHKHRCGIMNDPPGSGKTFVVMAMICRDLFKPADDHPDGMRRKMPPSLSKKTIIVVPFNIYTQWLDAAHTCCSGVSDPANVVRIRALVTVDFNKAVSR